MSTIISKKTGSLLTFFLCFSMFPFASFAEQEPEETFDFLEEETGQEAESVNENEGCFALYAKISKNADEITSNIQHLCQVTTQGRIVDMAKIDRVIDWLNLIQNKNTEIKSSPTTPLNKKMLHRCLNQQNQLIVLLNNCLVNSFKYMPDIDEIIDLGSDVKKRSPSKHIEASVEKNLRTLKKNVEECGLTNFNKFYGKIISPLIPWALIGGVTIVFAGGGYYLYQHGISERAQTVLANGIDDYFARHLVTSVLATVVGSIPTLYFWAGKKYAALDSHLKGNKFKSTNEQEVVNDLDLDDPCFDHLREKLVPIYRMIDYAKNPQKYSLAGIKNYKAVLLVGEPGSGKSHLARAIAGQLEKTVGNSVMITLNFDHYLDKGSIKKIFDDAKHKPGIKFLWIDEIHLYGMQAEKNVMGLQELLTCLDENDRETDPEKQLFIIAATNRPDLVEDPLKRQGRFGTIIELTKPLYEDRTNILSMLCKKSAINPAEVQIERLARLTNARPMSDLVSMFSQACFLAKNENKPVSFEHLYRALNLKLRGISEVLMLKNEEVSVVSAHLAGKAIAYLNLKTSEHLDMITLYAEQKKIAARYDWQAKIQRDEDKFFRPDPGVVYTYEENELIGGIGTDKFASVKVMLAGVVAQRILLGSETSYRSNEREKALEIVQKILCGGIDLKKLPRKEHDALLAESYETLKKCEAEIYTLLSEKRAALEKLAKELATRKMLRIEEITKILEEK